MRWTVELFGSGTHVVTRHGAREPHFYVYEAPGLTRYETCRQLAAWLNEEAPRPAWADTMLRTSETCAFFPALNEYGAALSISAVGPCVESEPGRGDWTDDPEFHDDRARLMDGLCLPTARDGERDEKGGGGA